MTLYVDYQDLIFRFLGTLKSFVSNKAQPKGSIAEGWNSKEILTFCSRYLENKLETRFNRGGRVNNVPYQVKSSEVYCTIFSPIGKPIGGGSYFNLTHKEKFQVHWHVLINCKVVELFIQ